MTSTGNEWRARASPAELERYDCVLEMLCEYFNEGTVPGSLDDKNGYLLGVATVFYQNVKQAEHAARLEGAREALHWVGGPTDSILQHAADIVARLEKGEK